jgi:L-gulonate 3-dehydrogenase
MAEHSAEKKAKVDKGKVAIIGSGLIGRCWATLFLRGDYTVVLYDVVSEQLDGAMSAISDKLVVMEKEGLLRDGQSAEILGRRVTSSTSLKDAMDGVVYVQECTPENLSLKQKVFAELDQHADGSVIMASSTSCIVPSKFTSELKHRAQCIVAHPINPPHYIPLVEVIPAPWTSDEVVMTTMAMMKELGQSPIRAKKEINGFILNRLQYALIMEGWRLVEDGIASPEDVDQAVIEGLGLRYSFMGLFETMHINGDGMEDYCKRYGANITTVCESESPARALSGETLTVINDAMVKKVPLQKLRERREWRERRLAALVSHKAEMERQEDCS